jgi:sulfofructose kinase
MPSTFPPPLISMDVLGVGSSAVDDRFYIDRFPVPDEKMPIRSAQRLAGGQTSTALVAAAHCGARAALCSWMAADHDLSRFMLSELEAHRVDTSLVFQGPGSHPFYAVILIDRSTGSRTILYNQEGVHEIDPQAVLPEWIAASRVVLTDQNTPCSGLKAARLAREMGIPVVADLERIHTPHLEELLDTVDHLVVNFGFARDYTGLQNPADMLPALVRPHQAACVVTCGSAGCWYAEAGGPVIHFPAFPIQVTDTTGCGDVFHGSYAAALARDESVPQAVAVASAFAALKAQNGGGWAGMPDLQAARRLADSAAGQV